MSTNLDKIMLNIVENLSDTDGISGIITKTLNRFCIEGDFSAQEACHQILQLQMVECPRTFVTSQRKHETIVAAKFQVNDIGNL
jgi:hypothetical protein